MLLARAIVQEQRTNPLPGGQISTMLRVQGIRKHCGGPATVDGVSFAVIQGSITSVIGPNGAGKTTLFNLISGLLPLTVGTVTCKDSNLTGWPPHRIAPAGVSRTFQHMQLFANLSALENVISARFCRTRFTLFDTLAPDKSQMGKARMGR